MTTAADLLRQALADAPDGLHVARASDGLLDIFSGSEDVFWDDAVLRLVGLLLAAAPHLAAAFEAHDDPQRWLELPSFIQDMRDAITEAAQAMEDRDE